MFAEMILWTTFVEGDSKAPLFNSYYNVVYGKVLLHSQDCSSKPLILTLWCWVLSKAVSNTIFLSLWYDLTWDWTPVSRTIGEHSTHLANSPLREQVIDGYYDI